jgi:sigma-B regulation protein RsbU (phosphoserine phosphatase)
MHATRMTVRPMTDKPANGVDASTEAARFRLLYDLGCAFSSRLQLDDVVAVVIAKCREVLGADAASILLHDVEHNQLYFPYTAELDPTVAARLREIRFPADHGIAGAVLRSGRPLHVPDVTTEARFYSGVDRRTGTVTRNLLCVPLRSQRGTIGVIEVMNRRGGGAFTADDLAFLDALAGTIAVALDNARMYAQLKEQVVTLERAVREHNELLALRRELDIARSIQQSIVPRAFPQRTDMALFADMLPAEEVGGDFYDFFFVDADHLGVVIGDVSGKGVPAALFMAVTRTLLRATALTGARPSECLLRVNSLLIQENTAEMFVTVFYGIVNLRAGTLEYSNGGHNPPYLLRAGGRVEALHTGGTVLGMLEDVRFDDRTVTLGPGDGVFLYTDGITEAMDVEGNLFADHRLQDLLADTKGASPEDVIRAVIDAVTCYSGAAEQSDDVTALAVRVGPNMGTSGEV